jgi:prepilin-type N-terminal cleavage/methylation domain-containing protein
MRLAPYPSLPSSKRCGTEAGFTLLEILVVIAILGLLIGLVAPAALRQLGGAKVSVAKQSIERLGSVLDLYKTRCRKLPDDRTRLAGTGGAADRSQHVERAVCEGRQDAGRSLEPPLYLP